MNPILNAKASHSELCASIGPNAIDEETAILSIGREFLPPCALAVLDGGSATVEYYAFLTEQTTKAQAENDAEYSAGNEWHTPID